MLKMEISSLPFLTAFNEGLEQNVKSITFDDNRYSNQLLIFQKLGIQFSLHVSSRTEKYIDYLLSNLLIFMLILTYFYIQY